MNPVMKSPQRSQSLQNTYSYEEVWASSLAYFSGDELAASTWISKYAIKSVEGAYLEKTPADMHRRMAREFARIEDYYRRTVHLNGSAKYLSAYGQNRAFLDEEKIFHLFDHFKYAIPQGSVMSSLGNDQVIASLSNCIVLPEIYDSYGGIFQTDEQMAQLFKRRCGVGIDLSTLRPSGGKVSNAAGSTTGAVSFMERFSNTTREVAQNGRRGALMMTMDISHPDIREFVTVKQDLSKVTGANISVRISDEFMKAVESGSPFRLRWPIDATHPSVEKVVDARELWKTIIDCAHNTAEPGIIFWDRQHQYSTSSVYPGFKNISTNPCSEIAMQGGDSCRLMALNLFHFVDHPFSAEAKFDFDKWYQYVYESQRLMDDLVDLELEAVSSILQKIDADPEPDEIKMTERNIWKLLYDTGKKGRRTGLGFTALADALAALGIKFDSESAIEFTEEMMKVKCRAEFDSSIDMAIERGRFEGFSPEVEMQSDFIQMVSSEFPEVYQRMMKHGRRNISISTVAPTGTLSLLAQTSSGIEPVFMLSYKRRKKVNASDPNVKVDFTDALGDHWQEFTVYHPKLKDWMNISGQKNESESPYAGATAPEIDWHKRVRLQAVVQKYTTHSISSTINLKEETPAEMVGNIYLEAWKAGLKGITVYRDGSRQGVLISDSDKKENAKPKHDGIVDHQAPERPERLEAEIVRFMNNDEKWIAFVGLLNHRPYEVFTGKAEDAFVFPDYVKRGWIIKADSGADGNSRYDFQYCDKEGYRVTIEGLSRSFNKEFWNYAKLISGVLRHGMPLTDVVDLIGNLNLYNENINTWKNGVERALKKFVPDGSKPKNHACKECGDEEGLIFEEGCIKCKSCGYSKCN